MKVKQDVKMNLATPKDPVLGTVVENRLVTDPSSPHFTRHWVVDVSGTELENSFVPGQAFGVIPEWEHYVEYNKLSVQSDDSKLRLYSIACPSWGEDGEGKYVSTTVKRVFDEHWETGETFLGVCSNYMCDMDVGDEVKLTGPTGRHFILPGEERRHEHNYVFLAAGTGIAPFRGMLKELLEQEVDRDIWLILGVPYSTDVLYGDFFMEMDQKHDNFQFLTAISREETTSDGNKMYVQEKMLQHRTRFEPLLQDENTLVYVCGLKGMETGIYRAMAQMGAASHVNLPDDSVDPAEIPARSPFWEKVNPVKERTLVEVY